MGTSSFVLISCSRSSLYNHRPMRWKQCRHVARAILDSVTPDHPKSANAKAVISEGEVGGASGVVEPGVVKKVGGICWSMLVTGGSGYMMFSMRGSSSWIDLRE